MQCFCPALLSEHVAHACGKIYEAAATCRLHNDYGHAVLLGYFHAATRLDHGVFPVQIVHLQLDEVHVGVLGQYIVEGFGSIMDGKAHIADFAPSFISRTKSHMPYSSNFAVRGPPTLCNR